jgi:CelD/BcsL family acetyltransferase involved in cellulose biosynthesis
VADTTLLGSGGGSRLRSGALVRPADGVHVAEGFKALAEEWDDLALRTGATPFARPGWMRAWWSAFGRGELRILTYRRGGELRAVLPLARYRGMLCSCSNVHSPLFDAVAAESEDLEALLTQALGEAGHGLTMRELDADGPLAAAARRVSDTGGCRWVVLEASNSSCIEPAPSWEEFEQSLRKGRRREARRRRRRLAETGEVTFQVFKELRGLKPQLEEFFRLEGSGWKGEQGTAIRHSADTERFYDNVAAWAAENGLLRLTSMRVDGRPVAAGFAIDDGSRRHSLKVGYDEGYSQYGPGLLHRLEEIRLAIEDGRTLELGTGMEAFKEELQNARRRIERVALFPRSVRGTVAGWAIEGHNAAYRRARRSTLLRRGRDAIRARRPQRRA